MATTQRWRGRIQIRGVNPYVAVTARRARAVRAGWRGPMPVTVRVNGGPDPPATVNMMPRGDGGYFLYLNGAVRRATATRVAQVVEVEVAFDASYRRGPAHPIPAGMARALRTRSSVRRSWDALSPSLQKEVLRYLAALRTPAARERNLARALFVLAGGRARFLGRDWNARPSRARRAR